MSALRPFFPYYGGKHRVARHYPRPEHGLIVERFAGSAGYACHHHAGHAVVLIDSDPVIAGLWSWLIQAARDDVLSLPDLEPGQSTDDLDVTQEARWLIGFWLNKGVSAPRKTPSAWMRQGIRPNSMWGPAVRRRVASQLGAIRHWQVIHGSYESGPVEPCTDFVDPPYQTAGQHYRHGARRIDYPALGRWCQARTGQVIVCENVGADWLPFEAWRHAKANESRAGGKVSREAIWLNRSAQ